MDDNEFAALEREMMHWDQYDPMPPSLPRDIKLKLAEYHLEHGDLDQADVMFVSALDDMKPLERIRALLRWSWRTSSMRPDIWVLAAPR